MKMKSIGILSPLLILFLLSLQSTLIDGLGEDCVDIFGNIISHGNLYVPGPSKCTLCACYNSSPLFCKSIFCEPPHYCKKFRIGERCCEYECLDTPDEIQKMKEKLRKRRRFLGIVFEASDNSNKAKPQTTYLIICIAILFKAM